MRIFKNILYNVVASGIKCVANQFYFIIPIFPGTHGHIHKYKKLLSEIVNILQILLRTPDNILTYDLFVHIYLRMDIYGSTYIYIYFIIYTFI